MIRQMGRQAAIVGLEKTLQDQTREQLMLRKLLGTTDMRIRRQRRRAIAKRYAPRLAEIYWSLPYLLYVPPAGGCLASIEEISTEPA